MCPSHEVTKAYQLFAVGFHGTEFVTFEYLAIFAVPFLLEDNRPFGVQFNDDSYNNKEDREQGADKE